jgi:N-formylglutamate amidohydrolase
LSKSGHTKLVKQITESGIANWIRAINRDNRPVPEIDPESQQRLLEYYRPYNQQLEDLLGRDLSIWGKSVS